MKVNRLACLALLAAAMYMDRADAAVAKYTHGDASAVPYVVVENNSNDNFFVTPARDRDPRMTGSNRWTGLKYTGSGPVYQMSLGYIDNGFNIGLYDNWYFDMWLDNSPVASPLLGLRCINWYTGCNMVTSLIPPQTTDASGFYGVNVPRGGGKWMHGMMSDAFYLFLRQVPLGGNFSMTINTCMTPTYYDATRGGRCKDQNSGRWDVRKVSHTKAGHLRLMNTNALAEVFINSDGIPTLGSGNADCRPQTIGHKSGLSCKMVNYSLQTSGRISADIRIFPAVAHSGLTSVIDAYDMQFSLDRNRWKVVSGTGSYYGLNDMQSSDTIYIFFSYNFFKQMVKLGISDINTKDLFNFRFQNTLVPESGWYEFSTSNELIIKPRDFGVSIISDQFTTKPTLKGDIGRSEPALDFGYIVTTSGKTAADEVLIKMTGPVQKISGRWYCIFSSADGRTRVPFPAIMSYTARDGTTKVQDVSCDNTWRDMTDARWTSTPWTDISGDVGQMDKTRVKFSIPMNSYASLYTVDRDFWVGEVSASGEIHVKATWRIN